MLFVVWCLLFVGCFVLCVCVRGALSAAVCGLLIVARCLLYVACWFCFVLFVVRRCVVSFVVLCFCLLIVVCGALFVSLLFAM